MTSAREIDSPEQLKFLHAVTLYGAVGKCIKGGKLFMTGVATSIPETKRFLVMLAGQLRNPRGPKPYLCMDNHRSHKSDEVIEEMRPFVPCFQPPYTS